MSALETLLAPWRKLAGTKGHEREAGTYFEELTLRYLKNEPAYRALYSDVLTYAEWAQRMGLNQQDAGIDLVAITSENEFHAVQCKLYAQDYELKKADIDSFFTASGKKHFTRRLIVSTTNKWSAHAQDALKDQRPPVTKIDLAALENSVIDWSKYAPKEKLVTRERKQLRDHQQQALKAALSHFKQADRGKLIMACGTGKTFTSLKIAEAQAGEGKRVLFLVPSLALLSQTLTEWTQESATPLHSFAVCSDSDVGKKRDHEGDAVRMFEHELQYPATTNAASLAAEFLQRHDSKHQSVVYATYHSIGVIHDAQKKHGLPAFDLVICDEAHRTTGATFEGDDESHFVKVHDEKYLLAKKRLYMTATPKIYGDYAKAISERDKATLYSMDDEAQYGRAFFVITFSEAVKRGLLVDYKVIVLAVDESTISTRIQKLLDDPAKGLRVDDAAKIVGCWKALAKQGLKEEELTGDTAPMKRAVAFCQVIEQSPNAKSHKVASKHIAGLFQEVVEAYRATEDEETVSTLRCEASHIDGAMNATQKEEKISWLKAPTGDDTCRVLSNVRCLSEGVDVPALDAVLFLTPRNSQIDVVQSVGRVMRNAPGKKRGYIVLPVVIPPNKKPSEALDDNHTYRVVWQVLQALRSHDDRFDAMVNKLSLEQKDLSKMEVIAVSDRIAKKSKAAAGSAASGGTVIGSAPKQSKPAQAVLEFEIGEIEHAIYAKLVEKVGNRRHWEEWAKDIAKIAQTHITRITGILGNKKNTEERKAFDDFAHELRDDLNDSISDAEIIEMLAQHLVTRPVFDALFSGSSFVNQNPMSKAMQGVLEKLEKHHIAEADTLKSFYESVQLRARGIESAEGRQKIVVELYDKFFRNAFPAMSERLGIVYTPVEIVDFILHSVDYLLRTEFKQTLGSEGVHILDPFTGTGTFITRLIQSGLIEKEKLAHKYKHEIHANELVLLAYYIAAINIEAAFHGAVGGEYTPFEGILLTDTFQLYEKEDLVSALLVDNSARRKRQKKLDIRVIIGNPPYSVNDNTVKYPSLDQRIAETYVARSNAANNNALYDSYIRAIRWASDRVGTNGIVGFVTNAGFSEANTADGLRKCLADEFSSLYVFHLRGNQRTAGELSRKEGGKVFGSGSRAPVALSFLVKNPGATQHGQIFFRDIGDYLSREEKLATLSKLRDIGQMDSLWQRITPDEFGDWVKQRDKNFSRYLALGDKSGDRSLFSNYSNGVKTQRDAWTYGASKKTVTSNLKAMVTLFNAELDRFDKKHGSSSRGERETAVRQFVLNDPKRISWTDGLRSLVVRREKLVFDTSHLQVSLYRPFEKQWLYFDRKLNERVYKTHLLFPDASSPNFAIGVSASESRAGYSVLMTDVVPSLHATDMVGSQYFPLYLYDSEEPGESAQGELLKKKPSSGRRDGITDEGLKHFQDFYPGETISKEDVFYYVYGVLHSPDYRERYADNLGKELPRIPRVSEAKDFWAFSKAGRQLGELHVGYEKVPEFKATLDSKSKPTASQFRVTKMKFGAQKDKTTIVYNEFITVRGVPLEAYDYVVNGKSAIEWVMERQSVTTDKDSGIVKDANDWAIETMHDARYPLSLLLRVITVSLETMKIVNALPRIDDVALSRENLLHDIHEWSELRWRIFPKVVERVANPLDERVPMPPFISTPDGFIVPMMNVHGAVVEYVHFDKSENITKRVPA